MAHETFHPNYHKHLTVWLIAGFLAIGALILFALAAKNSHGFTLTPLAAKITPTPITAGTITLETPHADDHVSQDFFVSGKADVPSVGIRLRDRYSGHVITEGRTQNAPSGEFKAEIRITDDRIRSEAPLILEVFNPVGAQELDKITMPLTFTPIGQ